MNDRQEIERMYNKGYRDGALFFAMIMLCFLVAFSFFNYTDLGVSIIEWVIKK